jgi:membrane protein implicated in regulation of membrane protease activity
MHLDIDEMAFAIIFVLFTAFLISIVEGLMLKLCFVGLTLSVLAFAIYIIKTRDEKHE